MKLKPIKYPTLKGLERRAKNVPFVETPIARMELNWMETRSNGAGRDIVIAVYIGTSWPERHVFLLNERGYEQAKSLLEEKTLEYLQDLMTKWIE